MHGRKDTATFWLSLKVFETTASDGQKLKPEETENIN